MQTRRHFRKVAIPLFLFQAAAFGASIGTVGISPGSTPAGVTAVVTVTAAISDPSIIASSVNLQKIDPQGRILATIGDMKDDGKAGDTATGDGIYTIRFNIYDEKPGAQTYRVSAGVLGSLIRIFSTNLAFNVTGAFATGISIGQPANLLFVNTSPIIVSGTTGDPNASVRVNGIAAAKNSNSFQTTVPLQEGNNTITAIAVNSNGTSSSASIQVTLDTTPPHVSIDSPADGSHTTEATVTVTGLINDIVVGTVNSLQASVTVNGSPAQVTNRTYNLANVPLQLGLNTIQVVGRDQTGNSVTLSAKVTRDAITQPFIKMISGNNQSGTVAGQLLLPLVVQALSGSAPLPNVPVLFKITENDGFLQPGTNKPQLISVLTNAQGQAQAFLTLGNRAGAGNNTVEAYAVGYQGTAQFVASGTPRAASKINVDSGNNQFGTVNQALALPFVAVVTDSGHNRLPNVPVTFTIKQGGGTINGQSAYQTTSDGDGRVLAVLTLGSQPSQDGNVVDASFPGNTGLPATFTATGKIPGNPSLTTVSGTVLDNSNNAIPGVTMRLFQTNQGSNNNQPMQVGTPVVTGATGTFQMSNSPVGFFKLMADGTTATQSGKIYPTLEYDLITVAGQDNTVGMPIYLPALDPLAKVCVDATTGGVLKVSNSPGFSLTILPGAATFPGGSKTGCVSVTPVNPDKVPMVPGFGQQPRYVVTIQPVGTMFNPPAAITIPNMDGLAPNAKTEMYSYDHDLAAFVAIGSATVSGDGSIIASDPGVGVLKAGWHCGGNPNTSGSAGTCPTCQKCQGSSCAPDTSQNGAPAPDDKCKVCQGGSLTSIPLNTTATETSLAFGIPSDGVTKINDALKLLRPFGVAASVNLLQITGKYTTVECCEATIGKSTKSSGSVSGNFGGFSFKGKVWPPGPIPTFGPKVINVFGLAKLTVEAQFLGGVFIGLDGKVEGEIGYRKDGCSTEAAEKNGCFYGNLNTSLTPSISAIIEGSGSLTLECVFCVKETISVTANVTAGNLSWPLNISSVGVNSAKCGSGITGGLFQPGDGSFEVSASFSGSYQANDGVTSTFSETFKFLSCKINGSGVDCQP